LGNMETGLNKQNLVAILVVAALSVINIFGLKTGALIQNVFTFAKVAGLLGLVIVGLFIGRNAAALAANFGENFWHGVRALHPIQVGAGGPLVLVSTLTILAVAQVGSLFSADAWNNVTFTAGEVINPKRNLPLSLALGTGVVIALYIACNVIYLNVLPLQSAPWCFTRRDRGVKLPRHPPSLPLCNSFHDGRGPCAPGRIGREDRSEGRSRKSQCGSGACSGSSDR